MFSPCGGRDCTGLEKLVWMADEVQIVLAFSEKTLIFYSLWSKKEGERLRKERVFFWWSVQKKLDILE